MARCNTLPALLASLLVMALLALLAGCGGGDAEDEPDQDVRPPACQADPKACI